MVVIKFFAVMKKLVGRETIELHIDGPTTLRDILNQVEKEVPKIREIIREGRTLISINQEMSDENTVVRNGDEIAMLPPFAGGSELALGGECRHEKVTTSHERHRDSDVAGDSVLKRT